MSFGRAELAGSLGDLGTFLPLLVGMSATNGLSFATALFFAGVFNIVTAFSFGIPMAVQPMKAIAAIALSQGLSASEIVAAGMGVSAVVLLLGLSGLIDVVNRVFSRSVVRGLQLALGLSLAIKGVQSIASTGVWLAPDSFATGLLGAALVVLLFGSRRVPAALILFCAGLALAAFEHPDAVRALDFAPWLPSFDAPTWADVRSSFTRAALPQIPLTTLNSVVAVCALSSDLFPARAASPRKVAISVGVMNLAAGWFGAMPMCHGAGGLASQHRFGARGGGSIFMLGGLKIALAIVFGASLVSLCAAYPASILGVMLVFGGVELASVARDQRTPEEATVTLATAATCIGLSNDFLSGVALGTALDLGLRYARKRAS